MHAVFGSRDDLRSKFKSESINLIQVGLKPEADEGEAIAQMRSELADCGLLDAGSGRKITDNGCRRALNTTTAVNTAQGTRYKRAMPSVVMPCMMG
jgi:hypothetical protein